MLLIFHQFFLIFQNLNLMENEFDGETEKVKCFLKNGLNGPLLILCETRSEGILSLKEIKNDYIVNNTTAKYNFIIKLSNITKNITINNSYNEALIFSVYPTILDFSSKDLIYIDIIVTNLAYHPEISFNGKEKLSCENLNYIQRCKVPKKHFEGKNDQYYYIQYYNKNLNFFSFKNKKFFYL